MRVKTEVAMSAVIRRPLVVCALIAGLACVAVPAVAQTGQVKGKVLDAKNQPVEKAKVTIEAVDGMGRKFNVTTNKKGEYIQIGLPPGQYKVTAQLGELSASEERKIGLDTVEIDLTIRPGGAGGGSAEDRKAAEARIAAVKGNFELAVKLSNEGKFDEAIAKFNEVLAAAPKCVECVTNIASVQAQKKDYDAAEASYKKAIEMNPNSAEAYNGLATMYNAQKKFDQASEAGAMAAKLGAAAPGGASASTVFNQAVIAWNAGKIPEAKKSFEEAVRLDPKMADAHYWLGMANLNEGKLPEAAKEFEEYLTLDPSGKYADQAKGILPQIKK
jgi:tetratricopeptide (TPR) repeat protein